MKRIIFVVTSLNSGGIENYLLRFLTFFDGEIKPIVICKGNVYGELEHDFRKIKQIKLIKFDYGFYNPVSIYKMYNFFKYYKSYSVCDFTGNFAGLILLTSKLAHNNTRLAFYRGSTNHFDETRVKLLYNNIMRYLVKQNATKILSNSYSALDYFFSDRDKNNPRYKVIYNGIDAENYKVNNPKFIKEDFGIPLNAFVIGHTGRYNSAKNHDTILKVADILCNKYSDIYFMLCGRDTELFLSRTISNNSVLNDKVKTLGYRDDIQELLSVFDLFFFPSITEGQPNSVIEAMISGLPIVASNINPIKETTPICLHKELIAPLNVEGFCDRIEEYYLSEKKREKNNFSVWAIERFNPNILFNQFYNEL